VASTGRIPGRRATVSSPGRVPAGSPPRAGIVARIQPISTAPSTARAAKVARQPIRPATAALAGSPAVSATVIPASVIATARPRWAGGAIRAA